MNDYVILGFPLRKCQVIELFLDLSMGSSLSRFGSSLSFFTLDWLLPVPWFLSVVMAEFLTTMMPQPWIFLALRSFSSLPPTLFDGVKRKTQGQITLFRSVFQILRVYVEKKPQLFLWVLAFIVSQKHSFRQ